MRAVCTSVRGVSALRAGGVCTSASRLHFAPMPAVLPRIPGVPPSAVRRLHFAEASALRRSELSLDELSRKPGQGSAGPLALGAIVRRPQSRQVAPGRGGSLASASRLGHDPRVTPPLPRSSTALVSRPSGASEPVVMHLSADELDGWDEILPVDGSAHARFLVTGEGEPWPASSG